MPKWYSKNVGHTVGEIMWVVYTLVIMEFLKIIYRIYTYILHRCVKVKGGLNLRLPHPTAIPYRIWIITTMVYITYTITTYVRSIQCVNTTHNTRP